MYQSPAFLFLGVMASIENEIRQGKKSVQARARRAEFNASVLRVLTKGLRDAKEEA